MVTDDRIATEADVVTKLSARSVHDTTAELTAMISAKGMKMFAVIDQAAEARQVGLTVRETMLVIFGGPEAGTPVMAASPLSALDLPLTVLIWADEGQTKVSHYASAALAASHHLSADLAANLAGIKHHFEHGHDGQDRDQHVKPVAAREISDLVHALNVLHPPHPPASYLSRSTDRRPVGAGIRLPDDVDPAAGPYVRFMFNSTRLTPKASASAPVVALRDVRKVYGRGDALTDALVAA